MTWRIIAIALFLVISVGCVHAAGCTRTFYIDTVGPDSNNGISKAAPWAHSPGMPNFAGSYNHQSGDCFIFKGGNTWTNSSLPVTPSVGGTATSPDYYGVDITWFTGTSFARPVFDDQLRVNDQALFQLANLSWITLDNLELKNMNINTATFNAAFVFLYNASNITIKNCNLHDWKSTAPNDGTKHGGIFGGSNITIQGNIISNAAFGNNGDGIDDTFGTIIGNTIHDMPTGMIGVGGTISGNTLYNINTPVANFDATKHTNAIYSISGNGTTSIFNNMIHDVFTGVVLEGEPCFGQSNGTYYIYNNLIYNGSLGAGGGGMIVLSNEGGTGASCGTAYIYNNTTETTTTNGIRITGSQSTTPLATVVVQNNHNINDSNGVFVDGVAPLSLTNNNNLTMSHATAVAQGYASNQTNPFSPTLVTNGTVAAGLNLTSSCGSAVSLCTDRIGTVRLSAGAWDMGAYTFSTPLPPSFTQFTCTTVSLNANGITFSNCTFKP